jgi:hypothetical protein
LQALTTTRKGEIMASNAKIEALELKLKQAKAAKRLQDSRIKAAESKKFRAGETRRKILLGSFVLNQLEKNGINAMHMTYEGARFSEWLTRDDDKKLFEAKG